MTISASLISCGVLEMYKLSELYLIERRSLIDKKKVEIKNTATLIEEVFESQHTFILGGKKRPFVIFSDRVNNESGGPAVVKYILEHKLGTITESPTVVNPSHNTKIAVWIWTVDWDALEKWRKENGN